MKKLNLRPHHLTDEAGLRSRTCAALLSTIVLLSACGGGSNSVEQVASGTVTLQMDIPTLPSGVAEQVAAPFSQSVPSPDSEPVFSPMATGTTTATYTPAQILSLIHI